MAEYVQAIDTNEEYGLIGGRIYVVEDEFDEMYILREKNRRLICPKFLFEQIT